MDEERFIGPRDIAIKLIIENQGKYPTVEKKLIELGYLRKVKVLTLKK